MEEIILFSLTFLHHLLQEAPEFGLKDRDEASLGLTVWEAGTSYLHESPISKGTSIVRPACGWQIKRKGVPRELL